MAKLERPQALEHLDEILAASDAVMVARGDLGLEMPLERVPRAQKDITRRARRQRIPVIVATQVLESMTNEARPTRAEVNDAANAVEDGVDAIMLAGETAAGVYPARAVQTLDAIIRDAELSPPLDVDDAARPTRATTIMRRRSARPRSRSPTAATRRRLSPSRAAAAPRGGCPRSGRSRRSSRRPSAATPPGGSRSTGASCRSAPSIGENVDAAGALIGQQLVARGLVPAGAVVVFVSISADLTRSDANYLKIQRL